MARPKICPNCEQEMNEDLAELNVCSECGQKFAACDLKEAREEGCKASEDLDDDEETD